MTTATAINYLTLFLIFPGLIGLTLIGLAVVPRRKNLLVSTAAALVWLFIGFWWIIGDIFTTLGVS